MQKFWTLIVYVDMHIEKVWASNDDVKEMLSSNKEIGNIYRTGTDQYAVLLEGDVFWKDIASRDYKQNAG